MHISHTKSFNIPLSIALATLAHMINVYEICLNRRKYPIFNMQDFIYCLWTSIMDDCFGQLVSPPLVCFLVVNMFLVPAIITAPPVHHQAHWSQLTLPTHILTHSQVICLKCTLPDTVHSVYYWMENVKSNISSPEFLVHESLYQGVATWWVVNDFPCTILCTGVYLGINYMTNHTTHVAHVCVSIYIIDEPTHCQLLPNYRSSPQ